MQPIKTIRLVIELHKTILIGSFDTLALLQDHAAELNDGWIRKTGIPSQINTSLGQWHAVSKMGRTGFKRLVDALFSTVESVWATVENSRKTNAHGPSATHPD